MDYLTRAKRSGTPSGTRGLLYALIAIAERLPAQLPPHSDKHFWDPPYECELTGFVMQRCATCGIERRVR